MIGVVTDDADVAGPRVHLTRDLLTVLLERADATEPGTVSIQLAVESAGDLGIDGLDPETPVFSTFYLPDAGRSVEAVFGLNVAVPPGQTPGLFISHPTGPLAVTTGDDIAERVIVAVPPWDENHVASFTRGGRRCELRLHPVAERDDPEFV